MSKYARRATQIVAQLYCPSKAEKVIAMIEKANNDNEVTRILYNARKGKVRA